jgi:hypothetical protein
MTRPLTRVLALDSLRGQNLYKCVKFCVRRSKITARRSEAKPR